ncbi:YwiB family protein [Enterococcus sp. LJL98]
MDLKKGMKVNIYLKTKIKQQETVEEFLFELVGQVVRVGNNLYIRYQEPQEDGVPEVPVTIKIAPDESVQLTRATEQRLRFQFRYEEITETMYPTPYGKMLFHVYTKHLHVSLKDSPIAGSIRVDYDLLMGNEKIGDYELYLKFSSE